MKNIEKVVVGSTVTSLEDGLFSDMKDLKEVDFTRCQRSVVIPKQCFKNCISLQECSMPQSQTICYDETFTNCSSLGSVQLPTSALSIGLSAFVGCSSLDEVVLPESLTSIADCAFAGCSDLESVYVGAKQLAPPVQMSLKNIGTSAFCNTSLQTFHPFNTGNWPGQPGQHASTFETVGEYAFANTDLRSLKLALRASADRTWWGEYCFASCYNLEDVQFLSSCYLGSHMFADCSKLKRVEFKTGAISYVGKYVFQNCASLQSIVFPKQQFSFLKGFFDGCTALKSVSFDSYGEGSEFTYLQKNAFNGCTSLTSVEFPQSLNQLAWIEDASLSNCALTSVNFHGIPLSSIASDLGLDGDLYAGKKTKISTIEQFDAVYQIAYDKEFPIIVNVLPSYSYYTVSECEGSRTKAYFRPTIASYPTAEQVKTLSAIVIDVEHEFYTSIEGKPSMEMLSAFCYDEWNARRQKIKNKQYDDDLLIHMGYKLDNPQSFINLRCTSVSSKPDSIFGHVITNSTYWKKVKAGSTSITQFATLQMDAVSDYTSRITSIEKTYAKQALTQSDVTMIRPNIIFQPEIDYTGFFRLCHDCDIVAANGKKIRWKYDSAKVIPYSSPYEYGMDMLTKSGFKTPAEVCTGYRTMKEAHQAGKNPWYYNAKEVVQQAISQHKPVLCFYSYETCTPCQSFKASIYEAADFQDWMMKQKFLVCRIEADKPKAYDKELQYCEDEFSRDALNYMKNGSSAPQSFNAFGDVLGKGYFKDVGADNKNLTPPVLVFYYRDSSGNLISHYDYSLHTLKKYIDSPSIGVEGVKQMIKSLCLYHFDNNDLSRATHVVDAGKEFNKFDYDPDLDNPYRIAENAISLNAWKDLKVKTKDGVKQQMKDFLATIPQKCHEYPEYIGGCLFGDFDWLYLTFPTAEMEYMTADELNATLDTEFMLIGDKYYKMTLDKSKHVDAETPCSMSSRLYKYDFIEKPYEPPPKNSVTLAVKCWGDDAFEPVVFKFDVSDSSQTLATDFIEYDLAGAYDQIDITGYSGTRPSLAISPAQVEWGHNRSKFTVTIPASTSGHIKITQNWSGC